MDFIFDILIIEEPYFYVFFFFCNFSFKGLKSAFVSYFVYGILITAARFKGVAE